MSTADQPCHRVTKRDGRLTLERGSMGRLPAPNAISRSARLVLCFHGAKAPISNVHTIAPRRVSFAIFGDLTIEFNTSVNFLRARRTTRARRR
jgi:hypothetical protein